MCFDMCYLYSVYQCISFSLFADDCVAEVSCGRNHTVCASASGRVFCWGDNTHSQCGVSGLQIVVPPHYIPIVTHSDGNLKPVLSESRDSTEKLAGDGHASHVDSFESDHTGRICYHSGCCHSSTCHASQTGCTGLLVNAKIVSVSCGWTHTAVLSNTGKLWAWGTGSQVGIVDCVSVPVPYPVEFPANRQVISVSCGGQHTVALTVRHEVSTFDAAAVSDALKTGVSRTVSYTPGVGQNASGELIKLSNVPHEAKKGSARNSASHQQKTDDTSVGTDSNSSVVETVNKAGGVDIPMQSLSSSSFTEPGSDNEGTNCGAGSELANTCIDDVFALEMRNNSDLPENIHSKNSDSTVLQTDNQTSNVQALTSSGASYASSGSVPKSRSSFLDETEAIIFLEKQLSDANSSSGVTAAESKGGKGRNLAKVDGKDKDSVVQDVVPSMSPFAKTVESLLQHVPSSPVVQEYVSNLTRTVVSNLRTSVDRRLNYVTSQVELSMRNIASLNKVSESCETEVAAALDDSALLERLSLSNYVSSF